MIVESFYWKLELLRQAKFLAKKKRQKNWREASFSACEKSIMIGFYAVRKLVEAEKVSDQTKKMSVHVCEHPPTGKPVTMLNWHKVDELFDLENPNENPITWSLMEIANQVIHSFIFIPVMADNGKGLEGFFLASDRQRHKCLLFLSLDEILKCFAKVGGDYPDKVHMTFNPATGDYDVFSRSSE